MNIREYIESGAIELYVMNALSESEAAEVETLALQNSEILAEIEEVQAVMQLYAQTYAQTPRPELKDQILDRIQSELKTGKAPNNNFRPESPTTAGSASGFSFTRILPWLAVVGLASSSFYFYQNHQKTLKAKEDCEQTQNLAELKNKKAVADLNLKLDVLKSPNTKTVVMKSVIKTEKDYLATVYWNADKNATYLAIQNLEDPPPNKQYQLWAIVNGKPVDGGVFEYNLTSLQSMKGFEEAQAFAVTLEPEGGSKSPTLDKMYVLGTL